jgi:ribosomal protein S18 acetylase RimI-like enzyme
MKPVDDAAVWSIVCFVIPGPLRRRGIAEALLRAAQSEAALRGEVLEAYPVDPSPGARASDLWFGTTSKFRRAGFVEVARRRPSRPVMRWAPTAGA